MATDLVAQGFYMDIAVKNLTVSYEKTIFVKEINFQVPAGEVFMIMGEHGCGKTQLIRHLTGLDEPNEGEIYYDQVSLWAQKREQRREMIQSIGVHYQWGGLWNHLTVAENIALPLRQHTQLSRQDIDEIVVLKLSLHGISDYQYHYPDDLNVNVKNLASLARALALDPQLLIFDEPYAGLDPISARHLDQVLQTLRNNFGTTIIMINNDISSVMTLADNIMILDRTQQGAIAYGPPRQLREQTEHATVKIFLHSDIKSQ